MQVSLPIKAHVWLVYCCAHSMLCIWVTSMRTFQAKRGRLVVRNID